MAVVLVTGANGQLGLELQVLAKNNPQLDFRFLTRQEMSIENAHQVEELFARMAPSYCINCAAYTAVDNAESEEETSFLINATAVEMLAAACLKYNAHFIHVSTDYVFDGEADSPYPVDARTNPQSAYGRSKKRGEELAIQVNPESLIIRTSWVFSSFGKNFVKTMLRLMKEKVELKVVGDQVGRPTYAADLAAAIISVIQYPSWQPGLFHFANAGETTWFEFAKAIREEARLECEIKSISTEEYPTPAKRPLYSVLNTDKFSDTFSLKPRSWRAALAECVQMLTIQA